MLFDSPTAFVLPIWVGAALGVACLTRIAAERVEAKRVQMELRHTLRMWLVAVLATVGAFLAGALVR